MLGKAHGDDNKSSDAEYISEPVCKLLNSFLSQLDQTDGSSTRLDMCGSLQHDNQVSKIDEIDFMTVESSKICILKKIRQVMEGLLSRGFWLMIHSLVPK